MPKFGLLIVAAFAGLFFSLPALAETADHPLFPGAQYPWPNASDPSTLPTKAAGDLDGDGHIDVAAVDNGDGVFIFFNNGFGGFEQPVFISPPSDPESVALGDIDNDDDLDMVTGNGGSFSVLLNDGAGSFSAPQDTDAFAARVMLEDLHGLSGIPELVTASGDILQIWSNNTDGTFTLHQQDFVNSIGQMFASDIDGDSLVDLVVRTTAGNLNFHIHLGNLDFDTGTNVNPLGDEIAALALGKVNDINDLDDLLVLSRTPNLLSVLINDGSGGFGSPTSYPIGINAESVLGVDLKNPRSVHDAVIAFDNVTGEVWVLANDGSGNLGMEEAYFAGSSTGVEALLSADFNNDSSNDILAEVAQEVDATVLVNTDDDDSKFFAPDRYALPEDLTGIAAADFNMDGYPDLAASVRGSFDGAALFFNNRDGTFAPQVDIPLASGDIETATAAHLNNDSAPDLVMLRSRVPDEVIIMLNNGDGTFGAASYVPIGDTGSLDPRSAPDIADFTGDGLNDIAVTNFSDDTVSLLVNDGTGVFGKVTSDTFNEPSHSAAGLFNSDGLPDLAIASGDPTPGQVRLYLNDGTSPGTFLEGPSFTLGSFPPSDVEFGDFDADGNPDLAIPVGFDELVYVLLGDGNGSFSAPDTYPVDIGNQDGDLAIADFNGDGWQDLVVRSNALSVFLNQGDGTFAPAVKYVSDDGNGSDEVDELGLANFDRDELDAIDIAVRGSFGSTPSLTVLPNVRGVELDEVVFCSHDPLLVQPGDDVEITAMVKDIVDGEISPVTGSPADVEIWVDDTQMPVQDGLANTQTHILQDVAAGSFTYGCRVTDGPVEVFSGWRRVAVGPAPNSRAIPVIYTGKVDERIDLVFFADPDYAGGYQDPAFLDAVENLIDVGLWGRLWFIQHQQWFNFWIAPDSADAVGDTFEDAAIVQPENWSTDYGFATARAVVHSEDFGFDVARSGGFTIHESKAGRIAHELGHRQFGLADEYPPGTTGGYYETQPFPNLHETLESCEDDAPLLGRPPGDCRSFTDDGEDWFLSEPETDDLMNDSGRIRAADQRRMDWLVERCTEGDC